MVVGILGQGFALYAYLPAFVELNYPVSTLFRYKPFIESRSELNRYVDEINYLDTESDLIEVSQVLVIARTPKHQFDLISNLFLQNKRVFLEKPVAPLLNEHMIALELLTKQNINFSVGYLFHLTEWFAQLSREINTANTSLKIKWELPIPTTSWKSDLNEGGGLGTHYAIHFVPVLKLLGFEYKLVVRNIETEIVFIGKGPNQSSIEIVVTFGQSNFFEVSSISLGSVGKALYSGSSPVGERSLAGMRDSRIDFLKTYIVETIYQESSKYFCVLEQAIVDFRIKLVKGTL